MKTIDYNDFLRAQLRKYEELVDDEHEIKEDYGLTLSNRSLFYDTSNNRVISKLDANGVELVVNLADDYDDWHPSPEQPLIQPCGDGMFRVPDIGVDNKGREVKFDARHHFWFIGEDYFINSESADLYPPEIKIKSYREFRLGNYRPLF